MSTNLTTKNEKINLKLMFKPFDTQFSQIISDTINAFWKIPLNIKLYFLSDDIKIFSSGTKFFVTQAQIQKIICDIRLSGELCEILLEKTLGQNGNPFKINEITILEGEILSKFSKILFDNFKTLLPDKENLRTMIDENVDFDKKIHLGFLIYAEDKNFEAGKLIFSVPVNLLNRIEPISLPENGIDVSCFTKAKGVVDIAIGKTKLSLDDMKQLDIEDIVLLEKSNIKKMKIVYPTNLDINVNPDPRLFINEDDNMQNDDEPFKEDIMSNVENIWDNVQVDVLAKFSKVKMSLGELRQMSEGLVVELDNVYDNKVVLEVEKKCVAKGELVIIGDKYGVRITEINTNPTEDEENIENTPSQNDNNSIDDDFDVNDFEIDGRN